MLKPLFNAPTPGAFRFEIRNFASNNAVAFDITDAENVIRIKNAARYKENGAYTLAFKDTTETQTRYLALTPSQYKKPETITPDLLTSWKTPSNGADYIIITHNDFYSKSQKLARYQRRKGMRVVTIKTEDIYDEFNSGVFHPQAIRDLLSYAYKNWKTPAPTYVTLIGDGCQDYKDNYHTYSVNYVPAQIVETELLGETPSDNWYVCENGDDVLPDMLIGRLSAQTPTEVTDMIDKIIVYDSDKQIDTWKERILLVADCLNGFFPGFQTKFSLAEGFQRLHNKGAVAVWAPTGLSFPYGHQLLMSAFYKEKFENGNHELGAATTAAKINTFSLNNLWSELVETYVLFGDPAMRVPVAP